MRGLDPRPPRGLTQAEEASAGRAIGAGMGPTPVQRTQEVVPTRTMETCGLVAVITDVHPVVCVSISRTT